ncbi:DUF4917 family protein [Corynebacterium bovis]|uniref:DUF4917 domain-containing protein n=1 Tax=Corynebacterium bovis TaxID=36808 RepID=A0A426Q0P1_9CORY|nr:hypothetical protein CXF48_01500 [Corynebacterium bovis]RRO88278.1 hypothetical protein CXF30_06170 [Corynebacterium bovis]
MLLYWTVARTVQFSEFCDGFDRRDPSVESLEFLDNYPLYRRPIYYLHGALHLYESGKSCHKLQSSRNNDRILQQIGRNLDKGTLPLIVTEGGMKEKEMRITSSRYLAHCHKKLSEVPENLCTYGFSASENDMHVLRAVLRSKDLRTIYFGIYDCEVGAVEHARSMLKHCMREHRSSELPKVDVKYYDSKSVPFWNGGH